MADHNDAVRRLITYAETRFGKHLTAFLLSGLGETEVTLSRIIVVTQQGAQAGAEFRIKIVSGHPEGLPRNDHPLVLLALLKRWLDRGFSPLGQLVYGYEEVFALLGWESSDQSQAVVDEAVLRYFNLIYETEYEEPGLTIRSSDSLLTGYRAWDETLEGPTPISRVYREVSFNRDSLKELKGRKLFGIDWRKVQSLVTLPWQPERGSREARKDN